MEQIVIVGGGLSGLTLAYLLEQKNYEITLIEASPRLGGRIQTAIGNLGTPLELGATWFSEAHVQLLSLLAKLEHKNTINTQRGYLYFKQNHLNLHNFSQFQKPKIHHIE